MKKNILFIIFIILVSVIISGCYFNNNNGLPPEYRIIIEINNESKGFINGYINFSTDNITYQSNYCNIRRGSREIYNLVYRELPDILYISIDINIYNKTIYEFPNIKVGRYDIIFYNDSIKPLI